MYERDLECCEEKIKMFQSTMLINDLSLYII